MRFGEKIRELRRILGYTQKDLGEALGVSTRTIVSYENGKSYPKQRKVYNKMAELFEVPVNYLLVENDEEVAVDKEVPSTETRSIQAQAQQLIDQASAMFAGGSLSEEDKDAVMRALQEAYWDARSEGKE